MKKIKNFMNKPMTWGGFTKFMVISSVVSMTVAAVEIAVMFGANPFKGKKDEIEADECDFDD